MKTRCIKISGCVEVPEDISVDEFCDKFILEFVEKNGWYFGGVIEEYKED